MVKKSEMPILDANGRQINYGDLIMQGMRKGDPRGWDEVVVVPAESSDEVLGQDPDTGERNELAGSPELRGLIRKAAA